MAARGVAQLTRASPSPGLILSIVPGDIRSYLAEAQDSSAWDRIVSDEPDCAHRTERVRAGAGKRIADRAVVETAGAARDDRLARRRQRARLSRARQVAVLSSGRRVRHGPRVPRSGADEAARQGGAGVDGAAAAGSAPGDRCSSSDDLEARGITLVVMPTPLKPGVHPEMLARRYADATGVLQNPSYRAFVDDLRRDGVLVFDPSEALAAARRSGPQYLATDTHWRPESMEMVAELLGGFIAAAGLPGLPAGADPGYRIERLEVQQHGRHRADAGSAARPVRCFRRSRSGFGASCSRTDRRGDRRATQMCLLLGDSFSNIYSLESMGWGTSAGFAEQLSYALRRPIDRLVQNDEGAFATREMLQRDPGRLDGKRVVVYQFAARELAFGDWKLIRF